MPLNKICSTCYAAVWVVLLGLGLTACSTSISAAQSPTEMPPTAVPAPTATPEPTLALWVSDQLPQAAQEAAVLPDSVQRAASAPQANAQLVPGGSGSLAGDWVYALVAPFPTLADSVNIQALQSAWANGPQPDFPARRLLVDEPTRRMLQALWQSPPAAWVQTLPADQLLDEAWQANTPTWAIIPFELIQPRWKVIQLDGQSPLHKQFDAAAYPLTVPIHLQAQPDILQRLQQTAGLPFITNRRADRLTTVMITGTTALVRGTASMMELKGMEYPAQVIGDTLREADILHISNEVSFAKDCPPPYPHPPELIFCSQERYIGLLESIGTDVVELNGDHNQDWGLDAFRFTLDLYRQRQWKTYGGGLNLNEAEQPALFEHNGNRIAFLGCNAKAKGYATVSEKSAGALSCNMDEMRAQVSRLRDEGYLPIVTFQHKEYLEFIGRPALQTDFRSMSQAGAVIVSGSQAHQPHTFEFDGDHFLHYGLGNLFFDQFYESEPERQNFLDRHVFYEGRYLGTELLTTQFVDLAQSRFMTAEERQALLQTVFQAGGYSPR